jgi:hypothetical protein
MFLLLGLPYSLVFVTIVYILDCYPNTRPFKRLNIFCKLPKFQNFGSPEFSIKLNSLIIIKILEFQDSKIPNV